MRSLIAFPRTLILLPYMVRFLIVFSLFCLCSVLLYYDFPSRFNGSAFAIPTCLASWVFRPRSALAWLLFTLVIITGILFYNAGFDGSQLLVPNFFIGSLVTAFISFAVIYLRFSVERVRAMQLQAKEAEEERTEEYEQRIEALKATREIVFAYEQMQKINQLKDDFITNITHELRTPLTQVYGYLELLNEHSNTVDEATRGFFLRSATEGCQELMALIDNAVDALSITETMPAVKLERILLECVIQDALKHIDLDTKQGFTIEVDVPATLMIWCDKLYLRRILQNLLTNACKYAPKATTVKVSTTPWVQERKWSAQHFICITVEDEGPGIPLEELPKLFGKFNRLNRDYSGSIRGSGLGLYICKQYVQALGGEIWVDSAGIAGQGSCFRFTIPIEPPKQYSTSIHNSDTEEASTAKSSENVV